MKRWQFILLLIIGMTTVCLCLVAIVFAEQNQRLQKTLQEQEALINKGTLSQQIGTNLLREMARVAQTDAKMRDLLRKNGYNLASEQGP